VGKKDVKADDEAMEVDGTDAKIDEKVWADIWVNAL
jgi:hypothetical protein